MKSSLQLSAICVILLLLVVSVSSIELLKVIVRVQNDLGDGINLSSHCRSKDDDLGQRDSANGENYDWSFNKSILDNTLFWCDMSWNNVSGHFDIYTSKRDGYRCNQQCWWSIRQDGAYSFNQVKNIYELLYSWTK